MPSRPQRSDVLQVPKTSPRLVLDTLRTLIAGRQIRGDLPSYTELASALRTSPSTIVPAVRRLRQEGYVAKHDNGRGHRITPPGRLQNGAVRRLVDDLETAAAATNVSFDDVVALVASRMLVRGDWSDERSEQLALIRSTAAKYRDLEHQAPEKTSRRPPSKRQRADAARDELEGMHPTGA